jgi:hypothetical protein
METLWSGTIKIIETNIVLENQSNNDYEKKVTDAIEIMKEAFEKI